MSTVIPQGDIDRFADVIVRVGLNLQSGQRLLVRAELQTAPLVRAVARSAYRAGAPLVDVLWSDEQLVLARVETAPDDSLEEFPAWALAANLEYIERGDALLSIAASTPTLLSGQNPERISRMMRTSSQRMKPVGELVQRNAVPWSVVSYPTPGWAAQIFPDLPANEREQRLWQMIALVCRLDAPDPVAAWQAHSQDLEARAAYMNGKRYSELRYRAPGTDLALGLADGHYWVGGGAQSEAGQSFVPNLPTEEIFTLPHRERAEGVLRSSRPLNYGGTLIEDFTLRFAGGRVVEASATRGEAVLRQLVDTDEGAARLGEVALVSDSSPVARTGLLFANTLFDENAASHLALGNGYAACVENGSDKDRFAQAGGNTSNVHVDFMIGSAEMEVDGITADGTVEPVMRRGEWAF